MASKDFRGLEVKSGVNVLASTIASDWSAWDYNDEAGYGKLASNGYVRNSAIAACVAEWALRFPEPPLIEVDANGAPVESSAALAPIKNNIIMDEAQLWLQAITYVLIGGNTYLFKVRNKRGQHIGMLPLSDGSIEPKADKETGLLSHYKLTAKNGKTGRVGIEDIVHLKWFSVDPSNRLKALSPLRQLAQDAETDNLIAKAINSILKNDATPKTAYILDAEAAGAMLAKSGGTLTNLFELIKQKFKDTFGGEGRGDVAVLVGGKLERIAMDFEELNSEPIRALPEARICSVLKVPPVIAGLSVGLDASTYSNYSQARLTFAQDRLCPMWKQWASALSKGLAEEGQTLTLQFDISNVVALLQARIDEENRVIMLVEKGIITPGEGREMLGLPELIEAPHNTLRDSVGGAQALLNSQIAYAAGQILREAGIANAVLMYGFTDTDAGKLFPKRLAPAFEEVDNAPLTPVETVTEQE